VHQSGLPKTELKSVEKPLLHLDDVLSCVFLGSDFAVLVSVILSVILTTALVKAVSDFHRGNTNELKVLFIDNSVVATISYEALHIVNCKMKGLKLKIEM